MLYWTLCCSFNEVQIMLILDSTSINKIVDLCYVPYLQQRLPVNLIFCICAVGIFFPVGKYRGYKIRTVTI